MFGPLGSLLRVVFMCMSTISDKPRIETIAFLFQRLNVKHNNCKLIYKSDPSGHIPVQHFLCTPRNDSKTNACLQGVQLVRLQFKPR